MFLAQTSIILSLVFFTYIEASPLTQGFAFLFWIASYICSSENALMHFQISAPWFHLQPQPRCKHEIYALYTSYTRHKIRYIWCQEGSHLTFQQIPLFLSWGAVLTEQENEDAWPLQSTVKGELWEITTENELMHVSVIVTPFRETDLDVTGKFGSAVSYNEGKKCIPGCLRAALAIRRPLSGSYSSKHQSKHQHHSQQWLYMCA